MMKLTGALICILVVALDVTAGILGLRAEIYQNREKHVKIFFFECRQPSHEAFQLGVAAVSLLLTAHVIANVVVRFICYRSREDLENSPLKKKIARASLLLSWIILVVASALLILGTKYNDHSRTTCSLTRRKFLWLGGVLCFVHGGLIAAYFVSATNMISSFSANRIGL